VGLRFLVLSGCLCVCKMDTETPRAADLDARPRRAIAIILIVMGVFIVVPFVLFMLAGKGAALRP
jgi:hypothetical protein